MGSETAGKEVAGVSGSLPAAASSDGGALAAVAAELGVGELKWRSGKLVGRSDRVEDGRRGEVSVQGRRRQYAGGTGRRGWGRCVSLGGGGAILGVTWGRGEAEE